jgi:hypothetical protein
MGYLEAVSLRVCAYVVSIEKKQFFATKVPRLKVAQSNIYKVIENSAFDIVTS